MIKNFKDLYTYFSDRLSSTTKIAKYNILALGIIGSIGHPSYWFTWNYIFPQPYDSAILRFSAAFLCFILLFNKYLPQNVKKLFPIYWFIVVLYALPFLFTVHLINNNFSDIWLMCQVGMGFMVASFIPNILLMSLNTALGVILAILFCSYFPFDPNQVKEVAVSGKYFVGDIYTPIWAFVIFAAPIFSLGGIMGSGLENKNNILKSLAGSIAHEMRNPFNAISLAVNNNKNIVNEIISKPNSAISNNQEALNQIVENSNTALSVIKRGNDIINITLNEMRGEMPDDQDFVYIDAKNVISESIREYGYKDNKEKNKVSNIISDKTNFLFKGDESLFTYIIFNLIKNALYYTKSHPDLNITIGSEKTKNKDFPHSKFNSIYVLDSGPGIKAELLSKLFGDFVTSGKKDGTGLGLSFCKRTIKSFGGEIICQSKHGEWTKFTMFFPKYEQEQQIITELSQIINQPIAKFKINDNQLKTLVNKSQEIESKLSLDLSDINSSSKLTDKQILAQNILNKEFNKIIKRNIEDNSDSKRILIADDQEVNILITEMLIKSLVTNAQIDRACNGQEVVDLIRNNQSNQPYDLVIIDLQMPVLDGISAVREIRKFDNKTPIVSSTSRDSRHIKEEVLECGIDSYISKPLPNKEILRTIDKWLINHGNLSAPDQELAQNLKNKTILIADDEDVNLLLMKSFLKKYQVETHTVSNGKELIEKYKEQFGNNLEDNNKKPNNPTAKLVNKYDIIISDVYMPELNGGDAIKEIRKLETIYNIENKAITIMNSGDNDKKNLHQLLRDGADDYFVKGTSNNMLIQKINFWIAQEDKHQNITTPLNNNLSNTKDTIIIDTNLANKEIEENNSDLDSYPILNNNLENSEIIFLRDKFISSVEDLIKQIANAKKHNNFEALAFTTHALKGITGNIGSEKLYIFISEVNFYAKNNKPIEGYDKNWFSTLKSIWQETKKAINNLK